ncbi:DUF1203 domain-containing protein [Paracoccus tegillarcae]|uniref:DUF1203 domain-containing protein n=1 Tax=Paracoccus tegillarcae TaxID=1529068 RepID=UPI0013003CE4|nr:DUF1203 domain-containing protein [Paracoccus tegillarcae]
MPKGAPYIIVAHRPFSGLNPYAETGSIFLCVEDCAAGGPDFPTRMLTSPSYIVRGHSSDERIVRDRSSVIGTPYIPARCARLFTDPQIGFV